VKAFLDIGYYIIVITEEQVHRLAVDNGTRAHGALVAGVYRKVMHQMTTDDGNVLAKVAPEFSVRPIVVVIAHVGLLVLSN
jgi:hypothetical protein